MSTQVAYCAACDAGIEVKTNVGETSFQATCLEDEKLCHRESCPLETLSPSEIRARLEFLQANTGAQRPPRSFKAAARLLRQGRQAGLSRAAARARQISE